MDTTTDGRSTHCGRGMLPAFDTTPNYVRCGRCGMVAPSTPMDREAIIGLLDALRSALTDGA